MTTSNVSTSSNPIETDQKESNPSKKSVCVICIGMAGSGKTTFVQRLNSYLHSIKKPPYIINLDPAVIKLPFQANIDIRDTVDYKEVMKQYRLGPNGGILTALNLFTTKFDQVLNYVEKRVDSLDHILVDTPGQIEIFTWSASGAIITDAIASSIPTVVAYVIDTPRTTAPATFMSNMLYACSILYKTRLPFILVFNKTDVQSHQFALEWMEDFEKFQADLILKNQENEIEGGNGYMNSLMNSMSLVLDEFYKNLRAVGCSAMTGFGMKEFFEAVDEASEEYEKDYRPELIKRQEERQKLKSSKQAEELSKLMKDVKVSSKREELMKKKKVDPSELTVEEMEEDQWDQEGPTLDRADVLQNQPDPSRTKWNQNPSSSSSFGVMDDGMGGRWPTPQ